MMNALIPEITDSNTEVKQMPLKETDKRIEELFGQWKKLQPLKEEYREKLDEKIRLEWNFNSNHIEGNTLNYSETKALLVDGKEEGTHPKRDYMEIKAHDLAINKIKEFAKDKERNLTEADIRNFNQIILKPFWKEAITSDGQKTRKKIIPGKYKTQPNHVQTESGDIFKFAEPGEVSPKMKELMEWFNKEMKNPSLSISSFLAELHHRFIVIHPFDDGNGRIARLWVNYVLLRFGYPPLIVKSEDKRNYFAALQRADSGDMDALAVYLGKTLIFWLEIGIKAGKGEDISEHEDIDKKIAIFKKEKKARGFEDIKPLSKKIINELYENLYSPLFETFENEFKQFDELFYSKSISFEIREIKGSHDWKKTLKEYIEGWEPGLNNTIKLTLSYQNYKGKDPFNMGVELSVIVYEFQYEATMRVKLHSWATKYISRKNPYSRILTEPEIEEFVKEVKEEFFNKLQEEAKRTDG